MAIDRQTILDWLKEDDENRLEELWRQADQTRLENVGEDVHLRGLLEFSNVCERNCAYCGLRHDNDSVHRYRMEEDEIIACAHQADSFDYGTIVLQSGEELSLDCQWLCNLVKRIKNETSLAVTLSVGERNDRELELFKKAGADRYLLRFETSNRQLFERIHPPMDDSPKCDRLKILEKLRALDYEVGSGVMLGIPGQTYDDLANDIELFASLDLDMIGVGPFIAHPDTPLGQYHDRYLAPKNQQVPATELMTYKAIALTRLICPTTNIPSTTALATLNTANGRELGLQRGANVVMPNLTPTKYRADYEIYPDKACITDSAGQCHLCLHGRIAMIGREVGKGRGDSINAMKRREPDAFS